MQFHSISLNQMCIIMHGPSITYAFLVLCMVYINTYNIAPNIYLKCAFSMEFTEIKHTHSIELGQVSLKT